MRGATIWEVKAGARNWGLAGCGAVRGSYGPQPYSANKILVFRELWRGISRKFVKAKGLFAESCYPRSYEVCGTCRIPAALRQTLGASPLRPFLYSHKTIVRPERLILCTACGGAKRSLFALMGIVVCSEGCWFGFVVSHPCAGKKAQGWGTRHPALLPNRQ
jgi:hypothetical protein